MKPRIAAVNKTAKIGLGGGCHWCTEAVFQTLKGVEKVEQGYVASVDGNDSFSEAVMVYFNPNQITLSTLIEIHLRTHKSTSNHAMREKYRSAVYGFSKTQIEVSKNIINRFQPQFNNKIITQVLAFSAFKASREAIQNYYRNNPSKPFCEKFINPKLKLLLEQFSKQVDSRKVKHLSV